ncbi:hypothetical protein TNIN_154351 [Trichonephila inaurata madagascariensis]|uniref:Uncharacterized protein n=1 Tax=Trichonephila inaurata madagascariensis TaxID=2747483 RepID=A0A8X7CD50_9ARAC|nr:hypothetical protein TNIN_154351 [Trichonephila inaurata madagascariensis]
MNSEQESSHFLTHNECDSDDPTTSMEIDLTEPTVEDTAVCERISAIEEHRLIQICTVVHYQNVIGLVDSGKVWKNQEAYDTITKEIDRLMKQLKEQTGELTLIGTCPIKNCQFHNKTKFELPKTNDDEYDQKVHAIYALLNKTAPNPENIKSNKTKNKEKLNKNKISTDNEDSENTKENNEITKAKKNNRPDGFKSSKKVAKKQKVLQNYSIGAAAPINTKNKFQPLDSKDAMLTKDDAAMPVAPKIPPFI